MKRGKKGKERLDKYYYMAKEQGYRARSAFKLIQLNKKYDFLGSARAVVDLCAAPGGWLQVATKTMPVSSIIVGVDIVPIRPIPNVVTLTADIRTQECRSAIRKELQGWKADVVLHDGAPNVGTAWTQDAYDQNELVLAALHLATDILKAGGTFVTKVFRSRDYNAILGTLRKLFREVTANKPAASRAVSAEVFVVCQSYLAPRKVDPALFDPRTVFSLEEQEDNLDASGQHIPSVLSKKALKNRKATGYEDGLSLVTKRITASDFVDAKDPLALLSVATEIFFDLENADSRDAEIRKLPVTSLELVELMKDLKILGKSEFKQILRWRDQVAAHYERIEKKKAEALEKERKAKENEAKKNVKLTPEERQKLLESQLDEKAKEIAKAERKKLKKQKKLQERAKNRVIEGADTLAAEATNSEALFSLGSLPASVELNDDDSGNELDDEEIGNLDEDGQDRGARGEILREAVSEPILDSDDEYDEIERDEEEMDRMYEAYLERKSGKKVQVRLDGKKRKFNVPTYAKGDGDDVMPTDDVAKAAPLAEMSRDPLEGIEYEDKATRLKNRNALLVSLRDKEPQNSDEEFDEEDEEEEEEEAVEEGDEDEKKPQMSKRAANWFGDSMFDGIEMGDNEDDDDDEEEDEDNEGADGFDEVDDDVEVIEDSDVEDDVDEEPSSKKKRKDVDSDDDSKKKKKKKGKGDDFEVVPANEHFEIDSDDDEARGAGYGEDSSSEEEEDDEEEEGDNNGAINLGPHMGRDKLATALAIGRQISMSKSARERMIDDSYNRFAFDEDEDDLPSWFADDERRHMRQMLPVSKDQIDAERQRLTAIDAKPIKRVYEAQARKRMRSEKRKEALRQKANQISEQADIDEAEKARMIGRLYRRAAAKSSRRRKTVLVHGKSMKRIGGAKKGRTKLVDSRMKKDRRGADRADAKRQRGQRKRKNSVQSHRGKKNKQK